MAFENVCDGIEARFRYVIGWLAQMIQQPQTKPGIALVLRGEEGVGKTLVGEAIGALFPAHYVKISQPRHRT